MNSPPLSRLERLGVSLLHSGSGAAMPDAAPHDEASVLPEQGERKAASRGVRTPAMPRATDASAPDTGHGVRAEHVQAEHVQAVSILDAREQLNLRRIERRAVWRAGIAGALSAGVTVLVMLALHASADTQPWRYWTWVLGVGALAAVIEIGFLYWDALRSVRQMAAAAGLRLIDGQRPDDFVVLSLARAALELPSPKRNELRVDPWRETSRAALLLATLVYKSKIALSSFLLKALLRRALGRLAARAALEIIAVPITAMWNMYVCRKVLREARLRVMGPSLAHTLAEWVLAPLRPTGDGVSETAGSETAAFETAGFETAEPYANAAPGAAFGVPEPGASSNGRGADGAGMGATARTTRARVKDERMAARQHHVRQVAQQPKAADAPLVTGRTLALWAVGTAFVKNRKVHPNVQTLVRAMGQTAEVEAAPDLGDCPRFLRALKVTRGPAKSAALRALVAASILDGKLTRIEREWLDVAFTVAGQTAPLEALKEACTRFVEGEGFDPEQFPGL